MNVLLFHINMQSLPWNLLSSLNQQFLMTVSYTGRSSPKKRTNPTSLLPPKKTHINVNCSSWQLWMNIKHHKLHNYAFDDWRSELNFNTLSHFMRFSVEVPTNFTLKGIEEEWGTRSPYWSTCRKVSDTR